MLRKQILFAYATARFCLHFFHQGQIASRIFDLQARLSAISTRSIPADFASPSLSASHLEPWFRFTFGCLRLLPLLFCFISFCLLSWPTQNDEQPKASEDPSCACTALEHGTLRPRCALSLLRVLCPRRAACARPQRAHVIDRGFEDQEQHRPGTKVLIRCKSSSNSYTELP